MAAVTSHLKMEQLQGRGRSLVASRPLLAGEVVLRDSPILLYSAIPFYKQLSGHQFHYCDHCFRTLNPPPTSSSSSSAPANSNSVLSCPSCSQSLFCSQNCHSASAATSHTPWLCQALSRLRNCSSLLQQPPERQIEARFLVSAYNLAIVAPQSFQILLSLQGRDCSVDEAAHFLHSIVSSFCSPPPIPQGFSPELTAALLSRDKLNAFGLMEPVSEPSVRAYGIYPKASMFNHDCLPNACRFDYVDTAPDHNTDIIVRMIHDIPEGREVCLSYFPVNMRYTDRQKRLIEDYGFKCDCDRCKVEANWSQEDEVEVEEEDEEGMDEDVDEEEMVASEMDGCGQEEDDFPHAYFFVRFMCNIEDCRGTLAPLPPVDGAPSNVMECNTCGKLRDADEDVGGDGGEDGFSMDE